MSSRGSSEEGMGKDKNQKWRIPRGKSHCQNKDIVADFPTFSAYSSYVGVVLLVAWPKSYLKKDGFLWSLITDVYQMPTNAKVGVKDGVDQFRKDQEPGISMYG